MDINITSRNLDLDESLKSHIYKRLEGIEHVYSRVYKADVVIAEEKSRKNTEIILHLKKHRIISKESSHDVYMSVDMAVETAKSQLRKLHDKFNSKKRRGFMSSLLGPMRNMWAGDESDELEDQPPIVKVDDFASKPMLPEEAKLQLDSMEKNFIMFKNSNTGKHNVLFRRDDGTYGLIEPKF